MENKRAIYQIKNLNHLIMRYCCEMGDSKNNLPTPAQMQILHYICNHQGQKIYQRDIAIALGLRRATLSEILKTMEKNELISRIPDKTDTRIKEIILSEKARDKFKAVQIALNNTEQALIKNIDSKELDNFFLVISKMQENLKNERMKIC